MGDENAGTGKKPKKQHAIRRFGNTGAPGPPVKKNRPGSGFLLYL